MPPKFGDAILPSRMTAPPGSTTAYIALGANLGDRAGQLRGALQRLDRPGIRLAAVSSFLENPAVGGPEDSPPFLNAVAEIETSLPPRALLRELLRIEQELGRERHGRWQPRTIDLDLILYGTQRINEPDLTVPHPRMHERRFVLQPLAEIAPAVVHPVLNRTASALLQELLRQA